MRMRFSPVFHFKRKPVYALPTLTGLGMFLVTGFALCLSILYRAPIEQWISFLMIMLTLLHLMDANDPFRYVSIEILPFDAPYANRKILVPVLISNPGTLQSEKMVLRFHGVGQWIEIPPMLPQSSLQIQLAYTPDKKGKQRLPKIRLKMRPKSELFQLWRVMESDTPLWVMPEPVSHGVKWDSHQDSGENVDVSSIEAIRDPRDLPKLDQKLLLKTGKPYFRTADSGQIHEEVALRWQALEKLPDSDREQQFAAWIEMIESHRSQVIYSVEVDAPFFNSAQKSSALNFPLLKLNFSQWVSNDT
jgi:hypothetical protein